MSTPKPLGMAVLVLLQAGASAQDIHVVQRLETPPESMSAPPAEGAGILWDQSLPGTKAWIDQAFTDLPTWSSYQVCDVSTGEAIWFVSRITTWYTRGHGSWSPADITTAWLSVFPKLGALPGDGDLVPFLSVPATLTPVGDTLWELSADTSGVAELQGIVGEWWIGLTPLTTWSEHGQEYRIVTNFGQLSATAIRNPGGSLAIGPAWSSLAVLDAFGVGGPYEASLRLEGVAVEPGWTTYPGTGLPSQTWFGLVPTLTGFGSTTVGSPVTVNAALAGKPGDTSFLIVGGEAPFVPFKGGVLVPQADILLSFVLGNFGEFSASAAWPAGVPAGTLIWFQAWTNEGGGQLGWCATNGLLLLAG